MRLVSHGLLFAVALVLASCDAIYERPELRASVDFGEPYSTVDEVGTSAPDGTREAPFISIDNRLVVDISFNEDCEASRFVLRVEVRDEETIDYWIVHRAEAGTCSSGDYVSRRLVFDLPANAERFRRQVLLTPDRGSIVLERELG